MRRHCSGVREFGNTVGGLRRVLGGSAPVLLALALAACLGKTTDTSAPLDILSPGTWTPLAPMPTARQEVAAAALEGRIFVIGGFGANAEAVATVEVYDPVTDRWEVRMPLPAPTHHLAAAVVGGRLFVAGGDSGAGPPAPPAAGYDDQAAGETRGVVAPLQNEPKGGAV